MFRFATTMSAHISEADTALRDAHLRLTNLRAHNLPDSVREELASLHGDIDVARDNLELAQASRPRADDTPISNDVTSIMQRIREVDQRTPPPHNPCQLH